MLSGDSSDSESQSDSRSFSRSRSGSSSSGGGGDSERPSQKQTIVDGGAQEDVREDDVDDEGSYHDEPDETANVSNDLNAMYKDLSDSDEEEEEEEGEGGGEEEEEEENIDQDDGEASTVDEDRRDSTSQVLVDVGDSAATN